MQIKRLAALAAALLTLAAVSAAQAKAPPPPIRIILIGDSTMAPKSGYGDAFCAQFTAQVTCLNGGRGGRSTRSYRVDGIWAQNVTTRLADKGNFAQTYVLIQFGHNDGSPNPERHTDVLWEYPANLAAFAKEVQDAGAVPILVTPITMRNFVDGRLLPDRVAPFAASMQNVVIKNHLRMIDLFGESQHAVQAMGLVRANRLAGGPIPRNVLETEKTGTSVPAVFDDASQRSTNERQGFDDTHLGPAGAQYFGKMVADLLVRQAPELRAYRKR